MEEALCIAAAHALHSEVVEDSLELTEAKLARTVGVHDGELLFKADQAFGTLAGNALFELVDD